MRLPFLPSRPEPAPGFNAYQAQLFLIQKRRQPIAEIAVSAFIFTVMWGSVSRTIASAWLVLSLSVQTFYYFLPRWLVDRSHSPPRFRLEDVPPYSLINGITVACPLFFFDSMTPLDLSLLTSLYIGLFVGSLATTATFQQVFLAYSLPFLAPLPAIWLMADGFDRPLIQWLMALILVIFLSVIVKISDDMRDALRTAYVIRHEREELTRSLKTALETAESANRAKTRFLASASHDLRQPIQTISLFTSALAMRQLDERSQSIVANLNQAVQDLSVELDALLDVSKLDAGAIETRPTRVSVRSILTRVHTQFRSAAGDRNLGFVVSSAEDLQVLTDRNHLERIVRNLVENAIKYTTQGYVEVRAFAEGARCLVTVRDTGCGIAPEEQLRVFDEFYQIDNPQRDRRRGLGLGLAIVKRLTALQGIPLSLDSTPGCGSCFSITLPLATGASPESSEIPRHSPQGTVAPTSIPVLHILAIDDDESVRHSMCAVFQELGWSFDLGASTADAVAAANQRRPDVLLTDFRLAGDDDGILLANAVRALHPGLPTLLVSGDSAPERISQACDAGLPILHKPVSADMLVMEIQRLLEASRTEGKSGELLAEARRDGKIDHPVTTSP